MYLVVWLLEDFSLCLVGVVRPVPYYERLMINENAERAMSSNQENRGFSGF